MKKLIITFYAIMATMFNVYSIEPEYTAEYTSTDKQYNAIIVETPAIISIEKGSNYHVNITNVSKDDFYKYEIINDTLVIKPKFKFENMEIMKMKSESLRIKLMHPSPDSLMGNIKISSWLNMTEKNKNKSGNQN